MNQEHLLREKLKQIEFILQNKYHQSSDIGVLSGISGIAIFQFYYAKFLQQDHQADLGVSIITHIIEEINKGYSYHTYCGGIAGAAWAIEFLKEQEFIDINTDELLSQLDEFLIQSIQRGKENNAFLDFLHGSLGIGYYYLKRYQNTQSTDLRNKYKEVLLSIINTLSTTAIKNDQEAKWESNLIREENLRGYNFSLSHGMSSIINFLARLVTYHDFQAASKPLLQKSINYILSFKIKDSHCTSSFPNWVTTDNKQAKNTRLAWCYGDLGIGISLWRAGKSLNNQRLCTNALEVLKRSTYRKDLNEAKIVDAGLCHGSYGIMQIYSYMYQETKLPEFKEASDYWISQALEMATHNEGNAGYMQWKTGENNGWKSEINLLEGIAGIGLSIISYLAPFKTKWDECLMIS